MSETVTYYQNIRSGEQYASIWHLLEKGLWETLNPENFEYNNLRGVLKREQWKSVLRNIIPIYPGMQWDKEAHHLTDPTYKPTLKETSWEQVIEVSKKFFNQFSNKRIGVQLSGGLDSSIIIGLLHHLKIPFYLVGMTTERYEFRTERKIQELLKPLAVETLLINYDDHLPLSQLEDVPPHEYPELLAINYSSENVMANACHQLGIEVLLTGDGGDNLFAEAISNNPNECTWLPQVFRDIWPEDYIYGPKGVALVPFYADKGFIDAIYNLRKGQEEDNAKIWARQYFKDILPVELVDYTYCADFWGLYIDGMQRALPTVKKLFNNAYQLSGHNYFAPKAIDALLKQDLLNAKKEMYQAIEARIALAVWLNGLHKKGLAL